MLHAALEQHRAAFAGRTVCVTGGAGFIGSNFVRFALAEVGVRVVIVDNVLGLHLPLFQLFLPFPSLHLHTES